MAKLFSRDLPVVERHLKPLGIALAAGAVVSAATFKISTTDPLYDGGVLIHPKDFTAYFSGLPFSYIQTYCASPDPCQRSFDVWGFAFNSAVWAVLLWAGWLVVRRLTRKRKRRAA
jgi:hypothetical protein